MKPEKLINFRIPPDLKEAFDSVCQETKQTRTHQLINLMRDYVDLETRRLDQQNQSIHHQISRSKNQYQDQSGPNHQRADDDWILVEENQEFNSNPPFEFYPWKGFWVLIQKIVPKTKSDLIKALQNSTIKEIRVFDETNCGEAITLIQKLKGKSPFQIIITK